jgi:hypothetical protein
VNDGFMAQQRKAPKPFPEAEWAFHKVLKNELRLCAEWELARLCGRRQKPWLNLKEAEKKRLRRLTARQGGFRELPMEFAHSWVRGHAEHSGQHSRPDLAEILHQGLEVIAFLVDFTETEDTLVHGFRAWLRSSPSRRQWRETAATLNTRWRSLLAKIVVLRATEANLTRSVAIEKTSELWRHWQIDKASAGFLSPPHWSRALRQAKALRKALSPGFSMVVGNPPFEGASLLGVLLALGEFPELARRRRVQLFLPKF